MEAIVFYTKIVTAAHVGVEGQIQFEVSSSLCSIGGSSNKCNFVKDLIEN